MEDELKQPHNRLVIWVIMVALAVFGAVGYAAHGWLTDQLVINKPR